MAYVPVPKDLSKVKTKVAFNLTKRQIICFAAALLMGLPLFFLLKDSAGTSLAAMAMIVVMLPCFLFAMYEKHGQPLEVVVKNIIQTKLIRPKVRPYQTENLYALLEKQRTLEKEVSAIVKRTDKKDAGSRKNRRKLTRAEKKQIAAVIRQAKGDGKAHTAQQTIPYLAMYPDGFAKYGGNIQRALPLKILTISLHRQTIRPPFLKTGAIFSTTLTLRIGAALFHQSGRKQEKARRLSIPAQ